MSLAEAVGVPFCLDLTSASHPAGNVQLGMPCCCACALRSLSSAFPPRRVRKAMGWPEMGLVFLQACPLPE